jgi:hypothetical protein
VLVTLRCRLYPHFERRAKIPLEFYHLDVRWHVWPIVMPAHDAIALACIVFVCPETTGAVFKLDQDALFAVASVTVRNAIWIGRANFFNAKLQALRYSRKQEDYAKLVFRRILKWGVLERQRSFRALHLGARIPEAPDYI